MKYLMLLSAFALTACNVLPEEMEQAIEVCARNEGLAYMTPFFVRMDVYCKDGAVFEDIKYTRSIFSEKVE